MTVRKILRAAWTFLVVVFLSLVAVFAAGVVFAVLGGYALPSVFLVGALICAIIDALDSRR